MSLDLVTAARDNDREAQVALVHQYDTFLGHETWHDCILLDGQVWIPCMSNHGSEAAATRCGLNRNKGRAARWRDCRTADAISEVSPGVIEWRWLHPTREGSWTSSRCRPYVPASTQTVKVIADVA